VPAAAILAAFLRTYTVQPNYKIPRILAQLL